jgi:hypothetical protein
MQGAVAQTRKRQPAAGGQHCVNPKLGAFPGQRLTAIHESLWKSCHNRLIWQWAKIASNCLIMTIWQEDSCDDKILRGNCAGLAIVTALDSKTSVAAGSDFKLLKSSLPCAKGSVYWLSSIFVFPYWVF